MRRTLRLHFNWLIVKLLGKDLLSKEELSELKDYGRLSLGDEVSLIERSFALGRQSALSKKSEYKDLTLDKLSKLQKRKYSSVEKLAIREAKLHTARRIQRLADEASADAYNRVNKATRDLVDDATTKDILTDEVALGVAEKKTRQQLATSIANKLGRDFSADMKKLAVTEMHRAKQRGAAMAIANKVGIYQRSEGVDSQVSVVPNKGACKDCLNLYLDEGGNPKVFTLKSLLAQGSNADEGVSHARGAGGLHTGWKPVMPPAHPNCYCELTYVPPGMAWESGKLKVVDELRYKESISKAYDSSTMSATIKPKGGDSYQKNEPPKPGSIPGVAAPGNTPGPGAPKGSGGATAGAAAEAPSPGKDLQPCPYGGGEECIKHGGNGATAHERGGSIMQEHAAYLAKQGRQDEAESVVLSPEEHVAEVTRIRNFDYDKPVSVLKDHIQNGESINSVSLKKVEGASPGVNDSYRDDIKGNGSILKKPGDITVGSPTRSEAASYGLYAVLGGDKLTPPCFIRTKDVLPASGATWLNDYTNAFKALADFVKIPEGSLEHQLSDKAGWTVKMLMDRAEAAGQKDKMHEALSWHGVMDLVMANGDRHLNNFMVNEDFTDIQAIDHGDCFNAGMGNAVVDLHAGFKSNKMHLKIPPALRERMENTSFGDLNRAMGEHLRPWQVAQTYLRMKFVMKEADENDGRLQLDRFEHRRSGRSGIKERFEDFMMDYIDEHSNDPSSPEYATANHFAKTGIFVYSNLADDKHFAEGKQFEREKLVRQNRYELELAEAGNDSLSKMREKWNESVDEMWKDEIAAAGEKYQKVRKEQYAPKAEAYSKVATKIREQHDRKPIKALEEGRTVAQYIRDLAKDNPELAKIVEENDKAETAYRKAYDEYMDVIDEVGERREDKKMEFEILPPGQEERFKELDRLISDAKKGPRGRKASEPMVESNTKSAADIEREKRGAGEGLKLGKGKDKAVKNFESFLQEGDNLNAAKRKSLVDRGFVDNFGKLTDAGKTHAGEMIRFFREHDPKKAIRYAHGLARNNGLKGLSDAEALKEAKLIVSNAEKRGK